MDPLDVPVPGILSLEEVTFRLVPEATSFLILKKVLKFWQKVDEYAGGYGCQQSKSAIADKKQLQKIERVGAKLVG